MQADVLTDRAAAGLRAIKSLYGKPEGEYGPTVFVSYHLEEIEPAYWQRLVGTEQPTADQILDSLVLVASWSSEDDDTIDTFDFALPDDVSHYLIAVRFRDDGEVEDIYMES